MYLNMREAQFVLLFQFSLPKYQICHPNSTIFLSKLKDFSAKLKDFSLNSRFRKINLPKFAEKRLKKPLVYNLLYHIRNPIIQLLQRWGPPFMNEYPNEFRISSFRASSNKPFESSLGKASTISFITRYAHSRHVFASI